MFLRSFMGEVHIFAQLCSKLGMAISPAGAGSILTQGEAGRALLLWEGRGGISPRAPEDVY